MKRFWFLFSAATVLLFVQSAFAQADELPDTVWTKFTYPNAVNAVKFTPDGKYLASGGTDGIPRLWNAETGELVREFHGNQTPIFDMDINKSGELIAGVNGSSIITIWSVHTGEKIKVIDQYEGQNTFKQQGLSLKFSNHGDYLAGMLMQQGINYPERDIFLWSTADWSIVSKKLDLPVTSSLTFSPDDSKIAVSNYVVEKGKITVAIFEIPSLKTIRILNDYNEGGIEKTSFSPDGKYLAAAMSGSPNKVWNTSDWKLFKEIGNDAISVAFSPDSKYVVLGEGGFFNWRVNIYDIELKKLSNSYKMDWLLKKHLDIDRGDAANSIDINQDLNTIVVGTNIGIYMLNAKWNPTSVPENPIQITEPMIFPNPANKTANIRFSLLKPSQINISIFDINSKMISNIYDGFLEQGLQTFSWNVSQVLSGTYFAQITANGNKSSIKIIVQR